MKNKLPKQEWLTLQKRKKEIKDLIRRKEVLLDIKDILTSFEFNIPIKKIPLGKLKEYKNQLSNFLAWISIFDDLSELERKFMSERVGKHPCITYPPIP